MNRSLGRATGAPVELELLIDNEMVRAEQEHVNADGPGTIVRK